MSIVLKYGKISAGCRGNRCPQKYQSVAILVCYLQCMWSLWTKLSSTWSMKWIRTSFQWGWLTPFYIVGESVELRTGCDIQCTSGAYHSFPGFGGLYFFCQDLDQCEGGKTCVMASVFCSEIYINMRANYASCSAFSLKSPKNMLVFTNYAKTFASMRIQSRKA